MDGEIPPEELAALLDGAAAPLIVDVRPPNAFARQHIPGSENVPFDDLPTRAEEIAGADHVVTVCPHGEASVRAARLIASFGGMTGRVESMAGGLTAWDGPLDSAAETGASEPQF